MYAGNRRKLPKPKFGLWQKTAIYNQINDAISTHCKSAENYKSPILGSLGIEKKSDRYFNFCPPILARKLYGTIILNEKGVRKTYTLYINDSTI